MDFVLDLASFLVRTLVVVIAIGTVLLFLVQAVSSGRRRARSGIEVEKMNDRFKSFRRQMQSRLLGKKEFKTLSKTDKKTKKLEIAAPRSTRAFVIDFDGDIRASATEDLREEITAILSIAKSGDEVILRLESGGGLVTSYGLASSQLMRLKNAGVKLTICVDKVAASGGYMMACVADQIIAAPFAVVGSIGVIAQVPNFNKVLKKHDVDYREVTAGEFKRTVTMFGEITEPGLQKFRAQLEETHVLFKQFINMNRPRLDIEKVATGEHWYGTQALALGLIDQIKTSDEYVVNLFEGHDVYRVQHHGKKKLADRFSESFANVLHKVAIKLWSDLDRTKFGT
ncbi:MAG: protease SohB [Proteobacteria bacterium]|nr:MAG: protease SohB [Pseudomonadota bacterium]